MIFTRKTKKILWVDDDATLLEKQVDSVAKEGWPITTIDCATKALNFFRDNEKEKFRGLLLDTMMDPIPEIGPHHVSGILTGILLAEISIERGYFTADNIVILTNCKQAVFWERAERNGFKVCRKSRYHGSKLAELIEREFNE